MGQKDKDLANLCPLTINDFDDTYKLNELPPDIECPLCMMIKEQIVECGNCYQLSCFDCNVDFTKRAKKGDIAKLIFECTTCHSVG